LPTTFKSSRQRILCRLPSYRGRWQRKAVGKVGKDLGGGLRAGEDSLLEEVDGLLFFTAYKFQSPQAS